MAGRKLQHLFSPNKSEPDAPPAEEAETDDGPGPCAALAKNKRTTALAIRHPTTPWDSFRHRYIGARSEFEPTRFEVEFVSRGGRYKAVVTGRSPDRIYALVIRARMERLSAAHRDSAADGQPIITRIEVAKVEQTKR